MTDLVGMIKWQEGFQIGGRGCLALSVLECMLLCALHIKTGAL